MSRLSRRQVWCVKLAATAVLLAGVLSWADLRTVADVLGDLDAWWITCAAALFVPQTLLSAIRWRYLCGEQVPMSTGEALRQTLTASAANLVVPGKLGDVIKSAMLGHLQNVPLRLRVGLVVVERGLDVVALVALWMLGVSIVSLGGVGLAVFAVAVTLVLVLAVGVSTRTWLRSITTTRRLTASGGMSLVLWSLHLAQIQAFILAAGVDASWLTAMARVPAAIFAGLVPVSLWGLGTRDATLIALYADTATAGAMATVGLLTASRYLVPGLIGVPCLWGYLSRDGDSLRDKRSVGSSAAATVGAVTSSPASR